MKPVEFSEWYRDYSECFPEILPWINAHGGKVTLARWQKLFAEKGVALVDAKKATALMFSGDAETVKAFERETTPAVVAKLAREIRYERRRDPRSEAELVAAGIEARDASGPLNLGGLFRELVKMRSDSATAEQQEAWLAGKFGNSDDRRDQYKCLKCRDSGIVRCVSAATLPQVERIANGEKFSEADAACDCPAGAQWINGKRTPRGYSGPLPMFDDWEHVPVGRSEAETRAACAAFVARRRSNVKEPAFANFNSRRDIF